MIMRVCHGGEAKLGTTACHAHQDPYLVASERAMFLKTLQPLENSHGIPVPLTEKELGVPVTFQHCSASL